MNRLSETNELLITRFSDQLSVVVGPDDMFPPNPAADREPLMHPLPSMPAMECMNLAVMYDYARARQHREHLGRQSLALVARIDHLIEP